MHPSQRLQRAVVTVYPAESRRVTVAYLRVPELSDDPANRKDLVPRLQPSGSNDLPVRLHDAQRNTDRSHHLRFRKSRYSPLHQSPLQLAIDHPNDDSPGSGNGSDSGGDQRDTFRDRQDVGL